MSLNICFVTETYPPEVNGVAMTVGRLVQGLRGRGHAVTVVRPRQQRSDRDSVGEITVAGLPLPGYAGLRFGLPASGTLKRHWKARRPDLVHVVTEGPLGWSAVLVARKLGIPVTSGFHTNFDRYSVHYGVGWMRPAVAAYLRALHRRTLATLVPTESLAADLAGEGIPGVKVVGRGVDTDLFDPARRSASLRKEWGVAADGLAVLYVGRVAPEKNLALVRLAFANIKEARPDARMIWVGDGPARKALEKEHSDHYFAGTRLGEDLAAHYASADLFLFPSLTETYGNVVPEAMASGLPVVAYRSAAAAELINDGFSGRIAPPGDEGAFVAAAIGLAKFEVSRTEMAAQARRVILPRAWEGVVARLEAVIQEVRAV